MKKKTWGGRRKGSGRPAKLPTKILSFRVPADQAKEIDMAIRELIKAICKI